MYALTVLQSPSLLKWSDTLESEAEADNKIPPHSLIANAGAQKKAAIILAALLSMH